MSVNDFILRIRQGIMQMHTTASVGSCDGTMGVNHLDPRADDFDLEDARCFRCGELEGSCTLLCCGRLEGSLSIIEGRALSVENV